MVAHVDFSITHGLVFVLVGYFALIVSRCLYHGSFLSPLNHIPGPFWAKFSTWWEFYYDLKGCKASVIHESFSKYGPAVRIGPNTVAFSDYRHFPLLYESKLPKAPVFAAWTHLGVPTLNSELRSEVAAGKRKGVMLQYATAKLIEFRDVYEHNVMRFVGILARNTPEVGSIDFLAATSHLLIDNLSEIILDSKSQAVEDYLAGRPAQLSVAMANWVAQIGIITQIPSWLYQVLSWIPHRGWQNVVHSDKALDAYVRPCVIRAQKQISQGLAPTRLALCHRLLLSTDSYTQKLWDLDAVVSECSDHFLAGVETTTSALVFTLYYLARDPTRMAKLRSELDANSRIDELVAVQEMSRFPYLNACLREGLRISGGFIGSERVAPLGGIEIGTIFIPSGALVMVPMYTTNRDVSVWGKGDPEEFEPERFLRETPDMKAAWSPFSKGDRQCPGMNLAMFDLRVILATIVRNLDITLAKETTAESTKPWGSFTSIPWSGELRLHFKKRSE